ncbi:MAG: 16S rRNA (cytidine(1402)-2'-O)-methyltransferase [Patescibacteria group bacterium]
MDGIFYVVATPIGNLGDITLRALETLRRVDMILAEDTRVTLKLLNYFGIKKPLISYREEIHHRVLPRVINLLREGKQVALISDAGTPAIDDPGSSIVRDLRVKGCEHIVPIPGPSAVTAAFSVAGIAAQQFFFAGYPPPKKKRNKFFEDLAGREEPVILFESPHRLLKTLKDLEKTIPDRRFAVFKELTKIHERSWQGTPKEILAALTSELIKGEWVIIIGKKEKM